MSMAFYSAFLLSLTAFRSGIPRDPDEAKVSTSGKPRRMLRQPGPRP